MVKSILSFAIIYGVVFGFTLTVVGGYKSAMYLINLIGG